jgi:hypothetical protein
VKEGILKHALMVSERGAIPNPHFVIALGAELLCSILTLFCRRIMLDGGVMRHTASANVIRISESDSLPKSTIQAVWESAGALGSEPDDQAKPTAVCRHISFRKYCRDFWISVFAPAYLFRSVATRVWKIFVKGIFCV